MRVLRFLLGISTRLKIIIAVVVVALGVFAIAYFEPHKLWIDEEVNEDFPAPVAVATTTATPEATPAPTTTGAPTTPAPDEPATTTTLDTTSPTIEDRERGFSPATEEEQENPPATTVPAAEEPATTTTAPPTTSTTVAPTTTTAPPTTTTTVPEGPVLLSSSEWISIGHPGTGTVLVYRQPDGSHVVRFENLEVSNGPDLLVILSAAPLVNDRAAYSAAEYLSLGDLKGNKGNQNYVVPADVNLGDYQTVAIWCRRFNYTFNAADIHSPPA